MNLIRGSLSVIWFYHPMGPIQNDPIIGQSQIPSRLPFENGRQITVYHEASLGDTLRQPCDGLFVRITWGRLWEIVQRYCWAILTHWDRDKMAAVSQTILSNTFSWIKSIQISIKISLKFVPKIPINNIPALVQIMARRRPGAKPLSEPMLVSLLTYIRVTRPQWVNLLLWVPGE